MKKQLIKRSMLDKQIWENTYTSLKSLVENSYYGQLAFSLDCRPKCDYTISYFNEFCTVRMCTSRGSGHSTAICRVAREYFSRVIFLSFNLSMAERLRETFCSLEVDSFEFIKNKQEIQTRGGGRYWFGSTKSLDSFRGVECEAVFIDGTFDLTDKNKDLIYLTLAPCMKNYPQRFFVFIQ